MAYLLEDFGCLACLQGKHQRAVRLVEAAAVLRESISAPQSKVEAAKLERDLDASLKALSIEELEQARAAGKALNLQQAIQEALRDEP
jgi:hypothetical protein